MAARTTAKKVASTSPKGAKPAPKKAMASVAPCCPTVNESLSITDATALAQRFAALGDPVRLRLFSMIASAGEVCSCNLTEPLGKSQPTISHHTKLLADAGLIVGEKRGRWVWWTVVPGATDQLRAALA